MTKALATIVVTVGVTFGCAASAASQDSAQFAYNQCAANPDWYEIDCNIGTYLGGANTVAHVGYAPHWSPDGSSVVYYDNNYGYIAVSSVVTGNETVLTDYYASWNEQPVWA